MLSLLGLSLVLGVLGQTPPRAGEIPESPAERLQFMKASLATYSVHSSPDEKQADRLRGNAPESGCDATRFELPGCYPMAGSMSPTLIDGATFRR